MVKQLDSLLLLLCMLSVSIISYAQLPDSSVHKNKIIDEDRAHSFFNNIISNPAYAGVFGGHNILVNADIDKPFFTLPNLYHSQQYNMTYDVAFGKKRNNAIGAYYSYSKGGIFSSNSIGATYARSFNLTQEKKFYQKLRIGASIGYNITKINWNMVTFGDMMDPKYGFVWNTAEFGRTDSLKSFVKLDYGAWYYNPAFYLGVATLINLDTAMPRPPIEFNISMGGKINSGNNLVIHPSLNVTIVSGFGGKLSTFSPAIICSFRNNYFLGISYKDLNKITVHAGAVAFDCVSLAVAYGISTHAGMEGFGYPAYVGGDLRINIKN